MNLKKRILNDLASVVCNYLKVNENLFFAGAQSERVKEARKYFCYVAIHTLYFPENIVSRFMSMDGPSYAKNICRLVEHQYSSHKNMQLVYDIDALVELSRKIDTSSVQIEAA
jgi:hypothetical protein